MLRNIIVSKRSFFAFREFYMFIFLSVYTLIIIYMRFTELPENHTAAFIECQDRSRSARPGSGGEM